MKVMNHDEEGNNEKQEDETYIEEEQKNELTSALKDVLDAKNNAYGKLLFTISSTISSNPQIPLTLA